MFFTVNLCGSRRVNFRVVQVENGSSSCVLGFWVVSSVPATARVACVGGRPRRGGLRSRVEGPSVPHVLRRVGVTLPIILLSLQHGGHKRPGS